MALFSRSGAPAPGGPEALPPLSKSRIQAGLDREGWTTSTDADGDIGGGWEYGSFYFFADGEEHEILSVHGSWRGQLPAEDLAAATAACNRWNAEHLWPKSYVRSSDSGAVRFHTEHNVDCEQGVSDAQLSQQLVCAVNTGMAFFEHLNASFPEAWARARPASG